MTEPDFEKVIAQTRSFLQDTKMSLETNAGEPIKFSSLVGNFYEFYEDWEMFNYNFDEKFKAPEDIEIEIKSILSFIRNTILQDDPILWREYVHEGIQVLREIKSFIQPGFSSSSKAFKNKTTGRIIKYVFEVDAAIKDYEAKFHEKFNPSVVSDVNLIVRSIEHKLNLKLSIEDQDKKLCTIKVDCIDADKILDLYEEIQKLPRNSKERKRKKQILKIWSDVFDKETNKK
jgi:hypothetical protein